MIIHRDTLEKHKYLREFVENPVVMKECEFGRSFLQTTVHEKYLACKELLKGIREGKLFGAVVCDVKVPEHEKDFFAEMPPIFKNTQITIEDVGPFMKNLCKRLDEFKTPRRALMSSFGGGANHEYYATFAMVHQSQS